MGFRISKLKKVNPRIIAIAVIPRGVNKGFLRRLEDFDHIVFDDELSRLEFLLVPQATVQSDTTPNIS
ncbi:MAG: hypothetical protein QXL47_03865, partial [Candidatus Anstonellales archaeon]